MIFVPELECPWTATYGGHSHLPTPSGTQQTLKDLRQQQQQQHWTGLKLQGKLACHPLNTVLDEDLVTQVLPTRLNLSI